MDMNTFYEIGLTGKCPNCGSTDVGKTKISDMCTAGVCNNCNGVPAYCAIHNQAYTIEHLDQRNNCPICDEEMVDASTHIFWWR